MKIFRKQKFLTRKEILNRNLRLAIPFVWIFALIFSTMAFASFTRTLETEGEATIQKHIYDYVYIEHVSISGSSNGVNMYYSFEDHEIKPTTNISTCDGYVEYALDIVNTTPYKAFITQTQVKSMINGAGSSTNSMTVEFTDVEANSTYIEPHSTKTIHVRVKNNCSGSDSQVTSTINFEYSLYKYFDLTVVADQSDAAVSMTTVEGTFTGTGSLTHRVAEGDTATYIASKHHYYDAAGNYKMETLDHTVNVTLAPDPRRDLTINISPTTHFNSIVTLKDSKGTVITPESGTKYIVNKGETYTYTVQNDEYYDATGSYTVNDNDGQVVNVTLQEKPWITGTITNTNRTTAATKTDTNYHAGYYLVEAWGGKGGTGSGENSGSSKSGTAGNIYGVVYIPYNTTVYSTAGGNGADKTNSAAGGANGGGTSGGDSSQRAGSGGGYSAFAVGTTSISSSTISDSSVKLIAAGGGGGSGLGGMLGSYAGGNGGAGGTLSSTATNVTGGTAYKGSDGTKASTSGGYAKGQGYGGNTSGGGTNSGGSNGSLLTGGNGAQRGGGGGAGYYGGGGGGGYRTPLSGADYGPGGGGGGSSFKASDVSTTIPSGFSLGSNSSSTGGSVKITWIGYEL